MSSRPDPLGFLNAELHAFKAQGLHRTLRVLEGETLSRLERRLATFKNVEAVPGEICGGARVG